MSVFQWKSEGKGQLGWLVVAADLITGITLVYLWGTPFFMTATLLPIAEAFLISDSSGLIILVVNFIIVFPFVIQEQLTISGTSPAAPFIGKLLGGEIIVGAIFFWLFLVSKRQEVELLRWQRKGTEEKKFFQSQVESTHKETDRLYRDLLTTQKELENLKLNFQSMMEKEREEGDTKIDDAIRREKEATRNYEDLFRELEESRKERENLNFLVETSGQMHESFEMDETIATIMKNLQKILPSQTTLIFLMEADGSKKRLYAEAVESPYADYFRNYTVGVGEEVIGWVAEAAEPAMIENGTLQNADGVEFTSLIRNEKSAIAAPLLKKDGSVLGVIYLGQAKPHSYSWQDVNVLLRFIPHIQAAIAKAERFQEILSQGIFDPLTGTYNAAYFDARLNEEVKRACRYKFPLSLVLLQVDHYEHLSSSCSEETLKQTMKEIAEMIQGYLREHVDVFSHRGNGRFEILLVHAEKSNAVIIAERIRLALGMRLFTDSNGNKMKLSASIGVAGYSKNDFETLDYAKAKSTLVSKGETVLAEALNKGGNTTCLSQ